MWTVKLLRAKITFICRSLLFVPFRALTLLVPWQERHSAGKICPHYPKGPLFGGGEEPAQTGVLSEKKAGQTKTEWTNACVICFFKELICLKYKLDWLHDYVTAGISTDIRPRNTPHPHPHPHTHTHTQTQTHNQSSSLMVKCNTWQSPATVFQPTRQPNNSDRAHHTQIAKCPHILLTGATECTGWRRKGAKYLTK